MTAAAQRFELVTGPVGRRTADTRPKSTRRAQIYLLTILIDIAMIGGAFLFAGSTTPLQEGRSAPAVLVMLIPVYLLCALHLRAYGIEGLGQPATSVRRALTAFGWTLLLVIGIGFSLKVGSEFSRRMIAVGTLLSLVLLTAGRLVVGWIGDRLLVDGPVSKVILCDGTMMLPGRGETVVNTVAMGLAPALHDPIMLDRLGRTVRSADRVVIVCPPERRLAWASALKGAGIDIELLIPEFTELGVVSTDTYEGAVTAVVSRGPLAMRHRLAKRAFDLFVILWLLPVLLLVTLLVAILIKLDDGGPVFFVQPRIGEGNRLFSMFKFRSMRTEQLDHAGTQSTQRGDPRVTRVGRILRSTSIDELPQLFNVLKGNMSIVGPRPHALASTAGDALFWEVDQRYFGRHAIKPGLTGLAQVRGFRGATATESDLTNRVQADLEYLAGWTLWRDIRIVIATFRVILHHNAF